MEVGNVRHYVPFTVLYQLATGIKRSYFSGASCLLIPVILIFYLRSSALKAFVRAGNLCTAIPFKSTDHPETCLFKTGKLFPL